MRAKYSDGFRKWCQRMGIKCLFTMAALALAGCCTLTDYDSTGKPTSILKAYYPYTVESKSAKAYPDGRATDGLTTATVRLIDRLTPEVAGKVASEGISATAGKVQP